MHDNLFLFTLKNFYNLKTIEQNTRDYVKKKFPQPIEEESIEDYREFIEQEYRLELASRLREFADIIEKEALK